jgi:hypothetical protein
MKQRATVDKVDDHKRPRLRNWQRKFIDALKQTPNVTLACRAANISREMVYRSRRSDAAFAEAWQFAQDEAVDFLETKAWDLAMKRDNVPLLIFLLRAHRKAVYAERPESRTVVIERPAPTPSPPEPETPPQGFEVWHTLNGAGIPLDAASLRYLAALRQNLGAPSENGEEANEEEA